MAQKPPNIVLQNVVKRYPLESGEYYQALNGITLTVKEGEFLAIMGPSGSGKSTLMHIMGALDTPTEGKQFFKGKDISSYSENQLAEIRNREIGFVFQTFNLLPRISVLKNVERPMLYASIKPEERIKRAMDALKLMKIDDKSENLANHISGGQIQRVALARALVMDPSMVLADEPTGNLDTKTGAEIMKFLSSLNNKGRTIIIITHDTSVANYAKRHINLVDGKIVSDKNK